MPEPETAAEQGGGVYQEESTSVDEAAQSGAPEQSAAVVATAEPEPEKPLFSREELAQFDVDDAHAGSVIGKMLSLFFLYTVIAMGLVGWWTFSVSSK